MNVNIWDIVKPADEPQVFRLPLFLRASENTPRSLACRVLMPGPPEPRPLPFNDDDVSAPISLLVRETAVSDFL